MKKYPLILISCCLSFLLLTTVQAATFCVTNSTQLLLRLNEAATNDQNDVIRIKQGTYPIISNPQLTHGFTYSGGNENRTLDISGGWISFNNNDCGLQINQGDSTVLDGRDLQGVMRITAGGNVFISNLSFINGFVDNSLSSGLHLFLSDDTRRGFLGPIRATIEKNFFIGNESQSRAAFTASSDVGRVYFKNNLVVSNNSSLGLYVATFDSNETYLINNTFFANSGGISISPASGEKAYVVNNLVWGTQNRNVGLSANGTGELYVFNNNYQTATINQPTAVAQNQSIQPVFVGSNILDFTPAIGSSMINAGKPSPFIVPNPITFPFNWNVGIADFEGNARVLDGRVDIGAVEAPVPPDLIFMNGFESS
ncbi:hypothetical protein [Marinicella sp. W31]|uniref:hypothetical protein n=1 Tax=Marinicella sp. W31 TaxID=3023713 RepID=UPI003756DAEF